MTIRYVDSAATGSNNGTSWANAFTTLAGAAAVDTAGDIIYVKSTHSESTASAVTYDWAGTAADPTRIICVSDAGEPPTTLATGAVVATTGANNLTISSASDYLYVYGVRFKAGDSTNAADVSCSSASFCHFENCAFELAGNNATSDFTLGGQFVLVKNCTFKSVNAGSSIAITNRIYLNNCSIESGGTPGNPFFSLEAGLIELVATGFDFSNLSASGNIFATASNSIVARFVNCKMPSSWSGSVNSSNPGIGCVFQLMNSDSTDTNYRLDYKTQFGIITHETTLIRTGGASNGTTGISWKMVANADAEWSHQTLDTPEIVKWNETTGSAITVTVEFLHDSATNITDRELWLEVQYLGTSGVPLGSFMTDAAGGGTANVFTGYLTSAADQTDSSETWTTTGMSNPNTQKMSVTFTPQEKGFIHATIKLAKASKTVYVDPMLTVT